MLTFTTVVVLAGLSLGDAKWAYTEVASADGEPCLADCKDSKCIVDWHGNEKTCFTSGIKAPTYSTSQRLDDTRSHCLSNCRLFGEKYEWCYTSEEGNWDFCNSSPDERSAYMEKCEQPCMKASAGYYCDVGYGWMHYCAPPATTN